MKFFYFVIKKKELMFFTKGGLCSMPRGWGAPIYKLEKLCTIQKVKTKKGYLQIENIKTKKWLCTSPKVKTKKLQMKVFQFQT